MLQSFLISGHLVLRLSRIIRKRYFFKKKKKAKTKIPQFIYFPLSPPFTAGFGLPFDGVVITFLFLSSSCLDSGVALAGIAFLHVFACSPIFLCVMIDTLLFLFSFVLYPEHRAYIYILA